MNAYMSVMYRGMMKEKVRNGYVRKENTNGQIQKNKFNLLITNMRVHNIGFISVTF